MRQKEILLLFILLVPIAGFFPVCVAEESPDPYSALEMTGVHGTIPLLFEETDPAADVQDVSPTEPESSILPISLIFIENKGQTTGDVLFEVISDGGIISFMRNGSIIRVVKYNENEEAIATTTGFTYEGSAANTPVEGIDPLPSTINFMAGDNPSEWVIGAPTFGGIQYSSLYPDIDLFYTGTKDGIKSTFIVRPGADPSDISMQFSGHEGMALSEEGSLVITTEAGPLTQSAPYCYQDIDGKRIEVRGTYVLLDEDSIGFSLGEYDRERVLVIDPVIQYSLYLRGVGIAEANGVAVDPAGNAYIVGPSLPLIDTDVVVAKVNPGGTLPLYVSYIGGSGNETGSGITVDQDGNAYITGSTDSRDFLLKNPVQGFLAGQNDAFVTKLYPNGTVFYSTYMGGTKDDSGNAIVIDSARNAYITGSTDSDIFPVNHGSVNTTHAGNADAFIVKVNTNGTNFIYSVYIGGVRNDIGYGIALDESGNVYTTGETYSRDFPVKNASQSVFGGTYDAFVTKVARDGTPIVYSTYIGGSDFDSGRSIGVDKDGYAHVTGTTRSDNFPLKSAFVPSYPGFVCSFYTRLEPAGNALSLSTYLTGPGWDEGRGIVVDSSGSAYIAGLTEAKNLTTINATQPLYGGGTSDAFVAKFVRGQNSPVYLSYLGGSGKDQGHAIAIDGECGIYVAGWTRSTDFPASSPYPAPFLPKLEGGFVTKIEEDGCPCQPHADFTYTTFECNRTVRFIDTSVQNPSSWAWQFGDGTTSSDRNPEHIYQNNGTYTVNLTVREICSNGPSGESTISKQVIVSAESPAVANFTATPTSGVAPLTVNFTDTSSSNTQSWSWQFGDGNTSIQKNTSNTYTAAGTYKVNLTASNRCGSSTITKQIVVDVCPQPIANFTFTTYDCNSTVRFTDTSSNNPSSRTWQFGDGATSSELNPAHTYTNAGSYTVNLTVKTVCSDGTFRESTSSKQVTVNPESPPEADFTATPTTGVAPLTVNFTDKSSSNTQSWSWQFGDGNTSIQKNTSNTYTAAGTYDVNLTVQGICGTDTITRQIVVDVCPQPIANFTFTTYDCNSTVRFTDTSSNNPSSRTWQFGDGATSSELNPEHTYTNAGSYTVDLTVKTVCSDGTFRESTSSKQVTVNPESPPEADFTAIPTSGVVPLTVNFTDNSSSNTQSWSWQFGDGNTSIQKNTSNTYTAAGTYSVNLTVQGICGTDTITKHVTVFVCPPPVADFTYTTYECNTTVRFTDTSAENPSTWTWQLGDGTTVFDQNPVHTYSNAGTYTVNLTARKVCDDGTSRESSISKQVIVIPNSPPVANFTATPTYGVAPLTVNFTDTSSSNTLSWSWVFGDGATSTLQNPVHEYTTNGDYTVTLTACNNCGCTVKSEPIILSGCAIPPCTPIPCPVSPCPTWFPSSTPTATATATTTATATATATATTTATATATATTTATTTVTATVTATTTATATATTTVTATPTSIIPQLPHIFYGAIEIDGEPAGAGTTITAVATGGEGSIITTEDGMYGEPGSTGDKLLVHGSASSGAPISFFANGTRAECYNVMTGGPWMLTYPFKSGELTELNLRVQNVSPNNPPLPEFVANTTSGVTPLSVKFTDTSLNGPTSWFWTFGDGNTSTLQNPVYIYLTAGVYTVNLTASNSAGTASIAKNNYISAVQSAPVAEFEANITQGMAPLVVGFTDKSSNIPTSWFWTFGDGNTSAERDPVHTYTTEGSYTVTLNVTNAGGFDTEIKENYIHVNPIVGGDKGYFSIHSNVDGANVFFDSDLKGTTASGVLVVPVYLTAPHYMNYTVTKAGYYPVTANLPGYPAKDQTVDINVNLVAIPPADVYYINATAMPGGQITPSQLVAVNTGQSQSFNINASSGYEITNILVDEQWMGKLSSYTFSNVTSNHTIVAYFTAGSSGPISGGGGGGGGGGGSFSVTTTTSPTTIPTTVGANVTPTGDGGDATGRGVTIAETGQITETPTPITTDTAAPPTTVSPAQPFWSKFPMVWLIPIILAIFIMAALAYYYYQRERGEEFFEEK